MSLSVHRLKSHLADRLLSIGLEMLPGFQNDEGYIPVCPKRPDNVDVRSVRGKGLFGWVNRSEVTEHTYKVAMLIRLPKLHAAMYGVTIKSPSLAVSQYIISGLRSDAKAYDSTSVISCEVINTNDHLGEFIKSDGVLGWVQ